MRDPFTEDKGAAKTAVMGIRSGGATALFDAIAGFSESVSAQPGEKAIIVFTDGSDNHSRLGAALTDRDLIQVVVQIADSTGGEQYFVRRPSDVEGIFQDISAGLNHAYLLAYKSPESAGKGWRRIQPSVRLPGKVAIRAKKGYYPQ